MHAELVNLIKRDSGRSTADQALAYVTRHPESLETIFKICEGDKHPDAFRAARVFCFYMERHMELLPTYEQRMLALLKRTKVDGNKRGCLGVWMLVDFTKYDELPGELLEICFELLGKRTEAIAVRASALKIIYNMVKIEPLLIPEFEETLRFILPEASKGMRRLINNSLNALANMGAKTQERHHPAG